MTKDETVALAEPIGDVDEHGYFTVRAGKPHFPGGPVYAAPLAAAPAPADPYATYGKRGECDKPVLKGRAAIVDAWNALDHNTRTLPGLDALYRACLACDDAPPLPEAVKGYHPGVSARTDQEWFEFCRPYVHLNGSHEMPNYAAICRAVLALAAPSHPPATAKSDDLVDNIMGLVDRYVDSVRDGDPSEHQIRERANVDYFVRRLATPAVAACGACGIGTVRQMHRCDHCEIETFDASDLAANRPSPAVAVQAEPMGASEWTLQGHQLATSGKAAWAVRTFSPDNGEGGSWGEWRLTSYEPPRSPDRWFQVVALAAHPKPAAQSEGLTLAEAKREIARLGAIIDSDRQVIADFLRGYAGAPQNDGDLARLIERATKPAAQSETINNILRDIAELDGEVTDPKQDVLICTPEGLRVILERNLK